jgi:hypothetical protein
VQSERYKTGGWGGFVYVFVIGARGSLMIKALYCRVEGRGFEIQWGESFQFT